MIEWPNVVQKKGGNNFQWCSVIYCPLCDISGTSPIDDHPLDGISILPFLHGSTESRSTPLHGPLLFQMAISVVGTMYQ